MLQTIVLAYIVSAVLLFVLAFVAYRAGMSQNVVTVGVHGVYIVSSWAAGLVIGIKMGRRRTLWGVGAGALYYVIILLMGVILNKGIAVDGAGMAIALALCIAGGFAGGFMSGTK
jgi:putative membrane protein (TIGR04086 family)